MWRQLWPMHRGGGYVQDHLTGEGMPDLVAQLDLDYGPLVLSDEEVKLFVARQWSDRAPQLETELLAHPCVSGLVYSSFRHDNPEAVARGDWRA